MTGGEMVGVIGGIAGGIIGVLGGAIGTYFSIKNCKGPLERSFMIKASIYCWIGIMLFLVLLLSLPNPYRWFAWIPYGIALPLGIRYINKNIAQIRKEESPPNNSSTT